MLETVLAGPIDVGVDPVQYVPDAEEVDEFPFVEESRLDVLGNGLPVHLAFSGDEHECRFLAVLRRSALGRNEALLPLVVPEQHLIAHRFLSVGQRFPDDATATNLVVVHDDEAAGAGNLVREIESDRTLEFEHALGHLVSADTGLGSDCAEGGGVDHALDLLEADGDPGATELEEVILSWDERSRAKPEETDAEAGGDAGPRLGRASRHLAARDVDLFLKCESGGGAGFGPNLRRPVECLEASYVTLLAGGIEDHLIANTERAALDRPCDNAPVVTPLGEFVDVLHRHPEWPVDGGRLSLEGIQGVENGGSVVPSQAFAPVSDIASLSTGDGYERRRPDVHLGEELTVFQHDTVERGPVVAHEIHLVDEDGDLPDAEHGQHVAVPPRVLPHSLVGVDDQQGGLRARRARDHVLEKLNVAWSVDDDVVTLGGLEEHPGGIDGDPLRLLLLESVE